MVECSDGEVTLSGTAADRSSKRRAEFLLDDVLGVIDVHNRIVARRDNGESGG